MKNVKIDQNNQTEKKASTLKILDRDALRGIAGGRPPAPRPITGGGGTYANNG